MQASPTGRWDPLGSLGAVLQLATWLVLALYVAPIVVAAWLSWPPAAEPPFSLAWVLGWTIGQAALSATLAVAAGWPLGVLAGFYNHRFSRAAVVAALAPFMSPVVVAALGLRALYGEGGLLSSHLPWLRGLAQGWSGVVALHSYFNIGFAAAMVSASAAATERSVLEHVELLGLRGPRLWLRVLLPLTSRGALQAWGIAFLYSFTSAAPLLVAGAAYRYYTLEAWLYSLYYGFPGVSGFQGLAAILALGELGLAATFSAILLLLLARGVPSPLAARGHGLLRLGRKDWIAATLYSAAVLAYLYAPIAAIGVEAAKASLAELERLASLGPGLWGSVANSLAYAAITTLLSLVLGFVAARGRVSSITALSLIAVTPVAYGVAAVITYYRPLSSLLGPEAATIPLILLAHAAAALPLASRTLGEALARLPREITDHLLVLGLRGLRYLRHVLGSAAPAVAVAAGLSAAASLGEFGATLTVSVPRTWSLTILVYHIYGSGRYLPEASLAAIILEAMSLATIAGSIAAARKLAS
ncbi:ABC transporter permease subunit [Pyrofollis japonicus]|nr:ABC transporter permease subunit [Pyrofollis japonicus]